MHASNFGWSLIYRAHETLLIDEEWTLWHEDGFTWWPHRHSQRIRFEGPVEVDGIETWWLSYETDFLRFDDDERAEMVAFLSDFNSVHPFSAAQIVDNKMVLRGRAYALEETSEHRVLTIAHRALMAATLSFELADSLVREKAEVGILSLASDVTNHPEQGERQAPDEMLGAIRHLADSASTPEQGANEVSEEPWLLTLTPVLMDLGFLPMPSDQQSGMRAVRPVDVDGESAVFMIDLDHHHPLAGRGLRFMLLQRGTWSEDTQYRVACRLNAAAWKTSTPLVTTGSWSPTTMGSVAYLDFYQHEFLTAARLKGAVIDALLQYSWGARLLKEIVDDVQVARPSA